MAVTRNADAVAPVRSSGRVSIWLTRLASTSLGALGRIVRHPFSSLMIVLVIAVTLAHGFQHHVQRAAGVGAAEARRFHHQRGARQLQLGE